MDNTNVKTSDVRAVASSNAITIVIYTLVIAISVALNSLMQSILKRIKLPFKSEIIVQVIYLLIMFGLLVFFTWKFDITLNKGTYV